tara:strand:- start:3129 stop:3791 length:663 start_codon:yes stop_codon:yes gene_type:complete
MTFSCEKCSKEFKTKFWYDKHLAKCTGVNDEAPPSMSDMYKMIRSMKKEIDSLKKTVAKYERNGGSGGSKTSIRNGWERNDLIETNKLMPIDVYFEDWSRKICVNRNDIYEIINSGHIQGIINVIWSKIESIENAPICIYNNTVMVYSKSGWKRITKALLSIATQNIQSQIPLIFETECPELSNINALDFNFDAYMKHAEILLAQSPAIECFMKCLLCVD